jgi:gliding motility-associated-like protein
MRIHLLLLVCIGFLCAHSPLLAQFHFNGTARSLGNNCYQLTDEQNTKVGSIWDTTRINLNESFNVSLELFFGCKDADGADGIVFGFQPVSTSIGVAGEGIGILGVNPCLAIEMDTYQNTNRSDPSFDHVAIMTNGNVNHNASTNLAGPVQLSPTSPNVEDCQKHDMQVTWDARLKKLTIVFDCVERLSITKDIVNEIFNGDPMVFWGFTAATGGYNNRQEVCLKYATFLDKLPDTVICQGATIQLNARGGNSYLWSPGRSLSDSTAASPIASPLTTTQYQVAIRDKCGRSTYDTVVVNVGGKPIAANLGRDTIICAGDSIQLRTGVPNARSYQWSTGSIDSIIWVSKSGYYGVRVGKNSCYSTDTIVIVQLEAPKISLPPFIDLCVGKKVVLTPDTNKNNLTIDWQRVLEKINPNWVTKYTWQDGSTLSDYVVLTSGFYDVRAQNTCGNARASTYATLRRCNKIFVPNTFSPNGDGINDIFYVQDGGEIQRINLLKIFDRWGSMVYSATNFLPNDENFGWDGGKYPAGVFTFEIDVTFKDGANYLWTGDITLLK